METLQIHTSWSIKDRLDNLFKKYAGAGLPTLAHLTLALATLSLLFLFVGPVLQILDPATGVLDIGILSVLLLGLIGGLAAAMCSLWLQELLWQPFKVFRKQFYSHFNQLSSWQQCILYFSVFFLLLYAVLWGLAMVL